MNRLHGGTAIMTAGLLACVILGTLAAGCSRGAAEDRVNIVLITVDTLRPDRLQPYGDRALKTPAIQRLAGGGVVFENAVCDTTWTIPSIASVMTGTYPFEHGLRTFYDRLAPDRTTLAELLKNHGYHTGAIVGSFPVDHRFGFDQGFDSYDDDCSVALSKTPDAEPPKDEWFDGQPTDVGRWFVGRLRTNAYRPDNEVADRALTWLDVNQGEPFFLWVHFFGPHRKRFLGPHTLSEGELASRSAEYDRDVEFMDQQVGRVLERIGNDSRASRTAIIFHSDHGETLDEHKPAGHGRNLYDETARVPLIVRLPGLARAGERVAQLVRNVDIFPTVLDLAAIPKPPALPGSDLLASLGDEDGYAYLETRFVWLTGLRTPRWKLILHKKMARGSGKRPRRNPGAASGDLADYAVELYDLATDSKERYNIAKARPERVAALMKLLQPYLAEHPRTAGSPSALDAEAREKLHALGYIE